MKRMEDMPNRAMQVFSKISIHLEGAPKPLDPAFNSSSICVYGRSFSYGRLHLSFLFRFAAAAGA